MDLGFYVSNRQKPVYTEHVDQAVKRKRSRGSFAEAKRRQFELEQKAKKERRARYARIVEENAVKRKLIEQERNRQYYGEDIVKALPLSSVYEKRMREAQCCVRMGGII